MIDRRSFVASALVAGLSGVVARRVFAQEPAARVHPAFPRQDPQRVQDVVTEAHRSLDAVRELVDRRPELAKASWDWGFGDWETPLGAASHTGQREIALYLLRMGARPNLFSAAMLGQLEVVRAFVQASPGIQGTAGPHGITLLTHARAGGDAAAAVVTYLEEVGGADPVPASVAIDEDRRELFPGRYAFGEAEGDAIEVEWRRGSLSARRPGASWRGLVHLGGDVFHPVGAPSVRLRFDGAGRLTVEYDAEVLEARR